MRNTADRGIQPALQRVGTAIANRSSFTAEGAAAFGAGGALSATKQVGESDDSVKGSFVIGEGAMAAATYNFKIWSTIKETNDGIVFKGNPSRVHFSIDPQHQSTAVDAAKIYEIPRLTKCY